MPRLTIEDPIIMAKINHPISRYMLNLAHVLPPYADKNANVVNALVEIPEHSINKYERINESGQLKLDRVGYSTLSLPTTYGEIPMTLDLDGDPLDALIANVTEPLVPGCVVEMRVLGVMRFVDGGNVDNNSYWSTSR